MAKIAFQAITKQSAGSNKPAVDAVTFEITEGTTCMLVGTSGSGKTTLLRMVNRLIEPTSGQIFIDGKNILEENPILLRRRIGYVIQQVGLFPHLNIAENVRVTAEIAGGWSKKQLAERVDELLELLANPSNEYVRKLVGADSILRQLEYLPVTDALDGKPEAVSSAHWGDIPTSSSDATLLEAMLKLLETNAPALAIQDKDTQQSLGYITLASITHEITKTRSNVPKPEETRI